MKLSPRLIMVGLGAIVLIAILWFFVFKEQAPAPVKVEPTAEKKAEEAKKVAPGTKAPSKAGKAGTKEQMSPTAVLYENIIKSLYGDHNPYKIPDKEVALINKAKGDPTYGTMMTDSTMKLLAYLKPTDKDVLYDLGSGEAKWLIQAYLATRAKRYVGIELSETRHKNGLAAVKKFKELGYLKDGRDIILKQQNILDADFSDGTLIYMCSTCYPEELMKAIADKFVKTKSPDARLITLKKMPADPRLNLVDTLKLPMSWHKDGGVTDIFIYTKAGAKKSDAKAAG